jgi:hypothetical protein
MSSTTIATHRSIAALKAPTSVPALISLAKAIYAAMFGNASFPDAQATLAKFNVAITDLETSEAAALSRTKGAATVRNQKRSALIALLEELKGEVQKVADADRVHAPALIQSAAMMVKKVAVRAKRVFVAKQGIVSGAVTLETASAARRASYEWQWSSDGGKTWQLLPASLQAKTSVTGLQAGTTYMFRYRAVVKTGAADWSQPVSLLVK